MSTKRPAAPGGRPVDASMDLLNQIIRQPVDPDYARVAARGAPPPRMRWTVALVAVLAAAMFTLAAVQTTRSAPVLATERTELIARIHAEEKRQDALRQQVNQLSEETRQSRAAALGRDATARRLQSQINALEPVVGQIAVKGPGLTIVVDDAEDATTTTTDANTTNGRVFDLDLQVLVNGLWSAGAEAIAINGHRLSNLTAIRGAGEAITVDYRSLTRPYRIEAIGNPNTLQAQYVESDGGMWWNYLEQNYQMRYEISSAKEVTLGPDPGMVLRYAKKATR